MSYESGIYSIQLRSISKWTGRTKKFGKVRTVWPKEISSDKNWGTSLGYYNCSKNRFYICSRKTNGISLQSKYLEMINSHLGSCEGSGKAFLLSISTGDKSLFEKRDIKVFRDSGLAHLLAVSGYHVGLVGFIPLLLIRSRYRTLRISAVVGLSVIWGFIIACGYPVSAIRSGIMITVGFISFWLDRNALPFNALAISAWIIAFIDPRSVLEIGSWLSYAATAGILAQVYSSKLLLLRIPIAAQTATLPIVVYTFQQIPIFFLPLNVVASLLITFIGALFGLSFIFQSITTYIAELCTALINALHSLEQLVPLSYQISNASAYTPGAIAGYAWLFSPVLPSKLSQIIGGTAILVAIFELWIKFI